MDLGQTSGANSFVLNPLKIVAEGALVVMLVCDLDIVKVFLWGLVLENFEPVCVLLWHYTLQCTQILTSLEVDTPTIGC